MKYAQAAVPAMSSVKHTFKMSSVPGAVMIVIRPPAAESAAANSAVEAPPAIRGCLKRSAKEALKAAREKSGGFKKEFIEFINRGSVVDLAVGVAVGGAFTKIVNSLVDDIVMPIVRLIAGGVDFTSLAIRIPNFFGADDEVVIRYGNFLQNVLQFLIIAWVIFMIIKAMNRLNRKRDKAKEKDEKKSEKSAKPTKKA